MDDTHHWYYQITLSRTAPFDKEMLRQQRSVNWTSDHRLIRNPGNRYLQDREAMKSGSFTGMGTELEVHDVFATESQGVIQDRTKENLGYSDKSIAAARRALSRAIRDLQEGREPPRLILDPSDHRFTDLRCPHAVVSSSADWRTEWVAYAG